MGSDPTLAEGVTGVSLGASPVRELNLDDVKRAARRLKGVVWRTPLVPFGLKGPREAECMLKAESLQVTGAFKIRGAYNALAALPACQRKAGVVATSSGNHALGVARAARLLGTSATIVMPFDAPEVKRAGVEREGARIILVGSSSDEWTARARELSAERGLTLLSSYDNREVIAGQGTVGLEILDQVDEVSWGSSIEAGSLAIVVPIGGGGLAAGVAIAVKSVRPDAVVVGVEPSLAAKGRDALALGRLVRWESTQVSRTMADGMRVTALGKLNFRILRRMLDSVVTVSEHEIAAATAMTARDTHLTLEPSGAASIAAWLFHRDELPTAHRIVCVATGGNVDPERYLAVLKMGFE